MPAPFDDIDHLLALDPAGRGITRFAPAGAAAMAASALRRARRVLIVTGFCIPPGLPETDGPPGAAALGRALRRLGARVGYVTDAAVRDPLAATLAALGEPAAIEVWPGGEDAAGALLRRERPTHLVAIERPGRARSGDYLSARGESVAAWNAPLDALFLVGRGARYKAESRGRPVTVGIGDGGNEIGMGVIHRQLASSGGVMARIASIVRVDHLVVAGTSNWGAYGTVAALSRLAGQALPHTPTEERRMLEACVQAGAVDGITRRAEPTVDGLPLDTQQAMVELLGRVALGAAVRRRASSIMEMR